VEVSRYISSTHTAALQSESTVLIRGSRDKASSETEKSESTVLEVRGDWKITTIDIPAPQIVDRAPVVAYLTPPSVSKFTQLVAEIDGVRCIVAEDAEGQIIHITTFANPLTDKSREAVYAAEASIIESHPDQVFDFHLRDAAQTETGTPIPIPGQHFFAVWGALDEESGRTSEAGQKQ
jgi:hypothetical protein